MLYFQRQERQRIKEELINWIKSRRKDNTLWSTDIDGLWSDFEDYIEEVCK